MPLPPIKSRAFALAAASAVAAPFVLRSDERGYFSTALMTTPFIAAATIAGGDVFRLAQESSQRFINFSKSTLNKPFTNASVTYDAIKAMRREVHAGNMFMSEFQRHNLAYLNDFAKNASDPQREIKALRSRLKTLAKDKSMTTLLSNAIQAEEYRVMSASELAKDGGRHVFKELSLREGIAKIRRRSKNADFVRGLNHRLRTMSSLKDQGGSSYPVLGDFGPGSGESLISRRYNFHRKDMQSRFSEAYGNVYEHLERAMQNKLISGAEFVTLNDPESKAVRQFSGLRLHRKGEKPLDLLLVQQDGGTIMRDSRRGVSRKIGGLNSGISEADIWTLRNLDRNFDDLRSMLNISQFQTYVDPLRDGFDKFGETEGQVYRMDPFSIFARNQQVVLDRLGGFTGDKGYMGLNPREQEEALVAMNQKYGLVKAWGDSNINKGLLETEELTQLHLGGVINTEKTSRVLRGTGKPIMASEARGAFSMSGARAPFSRTNKLASALPGETVPEFGVRIGMVSPHLKSLVSDLPAQINKDTLAAYANTAMDYISKDMVDNGVQSNRDQIRKIWNAMAGYLQDDANGKAVRRLGYLGEGDHLLLRKSGDAGMPYAVSAKTKYVHDLRLNDIRKMVADGTEFGPNLLLGFSDGNPVTSNGRWNRIQGFQQMSDGRLALSILESTPISSAKLDTIVKGLSVGTTKGEAKRLSGFMNLYGQITGTGYGVSEDTDILMLQHYAHNKAPLAESMVNIAADTFRRLETSGELGAVQGHIDDLSRLGFSYQNGTLVNDTTVFAKASEQQRRIYIQDTIGRIQEMMDDVGARVKAGQIQGDALVKKYLHTGGNMSLTDFIFRRAAPANAMITDSVEQNVVQQAGITYDMLGNLELRGFSATTKELKNLSRVDGDILMTKSAMDYLNAGDFSQPLGAALTVNEAFPNLRLNEQGQFRGLSEAEVRAGSVFDPAHGVAAGNWSLRLNDGSHVPVLGHEAYGGKINQYGAGEFSTNSREAALAKIVEANAAGNASALAEARTAYLEDLKRFGYGKESFLRARRTFPAGIAGRIQTRPASTPGNPFEIAVAPNLVGRIQDKNIREALLKKRADDVFAVVARHPVSNMPFARVTVDPRLNPNTIGIDEGMRGLLMADDDGDILNAFFLKPGGDAHREAAAAYASGQMTEELGIQRAFEGLEDDSRLARNTAASSLAQRARDVTAGGEAAVKEFGLAEAEALRRRPAGGSVGRFSNVLTEAMLNLEHNSRIVNPTQKAVLQRALWTIRQAPIAAQKKSSSYTLSKALNLASELSYGLHNEGGFDRFYNAMLQVSRDFGKDVPYNADMGVLGITSDMTREVGGQKVINPLLEYVKNNRSVFEAYHSGRNPAVQAAARALTATEEAAVKYDGKLLTEFDGILSYLDPSLPRVSRSMADHSAETLGAANEATRNVVGGVRSALRSPGVRKALGVGLGISALAGILTTSLGSEASFDRRRSANEQRPENAIGVEDHIPGEPVAGSMSPANPPRKIVPASIRTKTGIVAPVQQAVNLEVKMRSSDRSSAAEKAKIMARMSTDGDSNVTVNYRSRPKNTSLRMREKLRDMQRN